LITVIIPTYNRASFLQEAISSVLAQDYFSGKRSSHDWELLIIDDGSDDGTRDVVRAFGDRVHYVYGEHGGVSAARNAGLSLARGTFIAYLDSDDLWKKEKLRFQMEFMEDHPEAKVCCTEEIWIRHGRRHNPMKKHQKHSGWIFDKVVPLCLLSLSSALFRRSVFEEIGNFDEDLPACEDYDLGLRLAQKTPIYFLKEPLIIKRGGHPDQLSRQTWGMDRFRVRALEKALSLSLSSEQERLVRAEIVKKSRILLAGFMKRGNQEEIRKYLAFIEKYEC
jgi:glycosyltransferase involved in cell wall biosynthesis